MDTMLYAAVPRKLRVRTSIMFGGWRMPLRMFLALLGTGMGGVLILLAGVDPVAVVSSFVLGNMLFALLVEARWGSRWVSRSTVSVVQIRRRHLGRSKYLRLQPVQMSLVLDTATRVVRPVRWTLEADVPKECRDERIA
jgi:hypothetical protein